MGLVPGTSCEGVQMKFVDELLSKFKKVDESDRDRLRNVRSHLPDPEHEVEANQCENTSLGFRSTRTGPSKSTTRLRAFVKQKSVEDMVAEDEERRKRQEEFTSNALQDIEQQGH
jgi:hypothetical protein